MKKLKEIKLQGRLAGRIERNSLKKPWIMLKRHKMEEDTEVLRSYCQVDKHKAKNKIRNKQAIKIKEEKKRSEEKQ
jgi:hypothetical protein